MSQASAPSPSGPASASKSSFSSQFWRSCLATHNPLYALSAALVFYGLRTSFRAEASSHAFALMACLSAYTALLAVTALWLRRLGTLWEDVRMIALLVLLLLMAISVTFDQTLLGDARSGTICVVVGWGLAVAVCELLFWGLKVRLPFGYRLPFHALLALFFVYPLWTIRQVGGDESALQWTLFGFPIAAAIGLAALLPAVVRGPQYIAENGTPWRWPLYPGTLFFFLILGVFGRSYYLCYSFLPAPNEESIFGAYFLVPPLFSIGLLLLVGARLHGRITTASALLCSPLAWLAAASTSHVDDTFDRFLSEFTARFGMLPVAAAVYLSIVFYLVAFALRTPRSFSCLTGAVLLSAVVHGSARSIVDWQTPLVGPIAAAGLMKLYWGWRRREPLSCLVAVGCATLCVGLAVERYPDVPQLFVTVHTALGGAMLVGACFPDARGRWIRIAALLLLFFVATEGAASLAAPQLNSFALPSDSLAGRLYPVAVGVAALAYALLCGEPFALAVGGAILFEWCGLLVALQYVEWRRKFPGLDAVSLGLLSFVGAVLLSYFKARRLHRPTPARIAESNSVD